MQQDRLEEQYIHSNHSLHSLRSFNGSITSDPPSSPLVTALHSPTSPSTSSSSRHRTSNSIHAALNPIPKRSNAVPQTGLARQESETWGKYWTFPAGSWPYTRPTQTSIPITTSSPTRSLADSYDSHTSGKRQDSIQLNTSSEALSQRQRADTRTGVSTLDAITSPVGHFLSDFHSLAFEVAKFIDVRNSPCYLI